MHFASPVCFTPSMPSRSLGAEPGAAVTLPLSRQSIAWKVNAEPVAILGGGRALLLQVAHPAVAAGVEQHSTYATDPWARLFRTLEVMIRLSFGSPESSARQADALRAMHQRVVGTTDDGQPYRALDPALLKWVWATLVDTALMVYERTFPALRAPERNRYYEDWVAVGLACGMTEAECPPTWEAFTAYLTHMIDHELRVTPAARMVAHAVLVPPLPLGLDRLSARPHQLVTVGLLPQSLRDAYGFEWGAARQRRFERVLRAVRLSMRLQPRAVRELGMRVVAATDMPIRFKWLQRAGAARTAERMAAFAAAAAD